MSKPTIYIDDTESPQDPDKGFRRRTYDLDERLSTFTIVNTESIAPSRMPKAFSAIRTDHGLLVVRSNTAVDWDVFEEWLKKELRHQRFSKCDINYRSDSDIFPFMYVFIGMLAGILIVFFSVLIARH